MAQLPVVGFLTRQTGAVYAALLPGADADGLPALHIADAVGLGIFQHDQAHHQIAALLVRDDLVLGHDVLQHRFVGNFQILATLLKGHTKDGAGFQRGGGVVGVDGDHGVIALFLAFQHLQRVSVVAGGNDAVGNLVLDQLGGGQIAHIGQGDPVPEAGHTVGAAGAGVGARQGGQLDLGGNMVHLAQRVVQGQTHGGTGGGNVLKAGPRQVCLQAVGFPER